MYPGTPYHIAHHSACHIAPRHATHPITLLQLAVEVGFRETAWVDSCDTIYQQYVRNYFASFMGPFPNEVRK
jgi:hypothetical protein